MEMGYGTLSGAAGILVKLPEWPESGKPDRN
jgi:hypothetical protein